MFVISSVLNLIPRSDDVLRTGDHLSKFQEPDHMSYISPSGSLTMLVPSSIHLSEGLSNVTEGLVPTNAKFLT